MGAEVANHTTMVSVRFARRSVGAGAGIDYQDLTRQGCRGRDHRDVLVACPGSQYPPQRPAP